MNTALRIAFFNKQLPSDKPNGVSVQAHRLANALTERGHQITCYSYSPAPHNAHYRVVQLQRESPGRIGAKFEPARHFSRIDISAFDCAHYHGDDYLCRGSDHRVRTFYGSALHEAIYARTFARRAYQTLFYLFELVSCMRKGHKAAISHVTSSALPGLVTVIPCGVPPELTPRGPKSSHPSILFIGDLGSRKRGDLVVNAFVQEVLPRLPNCTLYIIGPQKVAAAGVIWLGQVSDASLIDHYRSAWVLCSASSYEGFGVPLIEAMSCGTAVVTTPHAGCREIIDSPNAGLICTPHSLGATLVSVLTDPLLRGRLEVGGLERSRFFSIDNVAQQYERLYYSCRDMQLGATPTQLPVTPCRSTLNP